MVDGILTAIVTPFKNGEIDWPALSGLVDRQINAGVSGLIVSGTTGESPTLSKDEKKQLVNFVVNQVAGKSAVIAGTGNNNTAETIQLSQWAAEAGVDGLLLVVPYYNKPTQEGLYQHFAAVADAVKPMPIFLYNVPGRTVADLLPETVARLAERENITHVKEATGLMNRVEEIVKLAPRLTVLSGDDKTFFAGLEYGFKGIISVASNIFPEKMLEIYSAYTSGDVAKATALNEKMKPFYEFIFCEPNPVPVKAIAAHLGWIQNELRLPLVPLSAENSKKIVPLLNSL